MLNNSTAHSLIEPLKHNNGTDVLYVNLNGKIHQGSDDTENEKINYIHEHIFTSTQQKKAITTINGLNEHLREFLVNEPSLFCVNEDIINEYKERITEKKILTIEREDTYFMRYLYKKYLNRATPFRYDKTLNDILKNLNNDILQEPEKKSEPESEPEPEPESETEPESEPTRLSRPIQALFDFATDNRNFQPRPVGNDSFTVAPKLEGTPSDFKLLQKFFNAQFFIAPRYPGEDTYGRFNTKYTKVYNPAPLTSTEEYHNNRNPLYHTNILDRISKDFGKKFQRKYSLLKMFVTDFFYYDLYTKFFHYFLVKSKWQNKFKPILKTVTPRTMFKIFTEKTASVIPWKKESTIDIPTRIQFYNKHLHINKKNIPKFIKIKNNIDGVEFFTTVYANKNENDKLENGKNVKENSVESFKAEYKPDNGDTSTTGTVGKNIINNALNPIDMEIEAIEYFKNKENYRPIIENDKKKNIFKKYGWSKVESEVESTEKLLQDITDEEFNTKVLEINSNKQTNKQKKEKKKNQEKKERW